MREMELQFTGNASPLCSGKGVFRGLPGVLAMPCSSACIYVLPTQGSLLVIYGCSYCKPKFWGCKVLVASTLTTLIEHS